MQYVTALMLKDTISNYAPYLNIWYLDCVNSIN